MTKKMLLAQFIALCSVFAVLVCFGCKHFDGTSDISIAADDEDDAKELHDNTGVSDKDEVTGGGSSIITDNFIRGFDASYVDYYETDLNYKYYDTNGAEKDFFEILANHAINTVRLRIWVDPENAETNGVVSGDSSWNASGMNTLERTLRLAKRAKAAGLKLLLDFHYSDYWTDPGKQVIPYAWQNITTAEAMAKKLGDYTTEVLTAMKEADVLPEYVQVGNEIDSGILVHTKYNGSGGATKADAAVCGTSGSDNFTAYLKAGCDAVRASAPNAKIILHVTNRKPTNILTKALSAQLDYDIVGLSYYPWESSHGTIKSLRDNTKAFTGSAYGKAVMVVESSMYWNYGDYDENKVDLRYVAQHMIDPTTNKIYTDLTTATVTYQNQDITIVEGSVSNQINTLRHIIKESADCGATGMFSWGGDLRGDWKYALFDGNGKAMASIDAFNLSVEVNTDNADTGGEETSAETMQAAFVFKDFTAKKLTVTYGGDGNTNIADAKIAEDGKSATLALDGNYKKSSGWMDIISIKAYANVTDTEPLDIEFDSSSNNESGAWFEFVTDGNITITYKMVVTGISLYSDSYTANNDISQLISADDVKNLNIKSLIIEATDCDWSNTNGDWWITVYTASSWANPMNLTWMNNTYYKLEITDESFISAVQTNGLYIAGLSGMTGTIKVSYTSD